MSKSNMLELTVTVQVEALAQWPNRLQYALEDIGSTIVSMPELSEVKGESTEATFRYAIKAVE